jgi:recombination protein RecT
MSAAPKPEVSEVSNLPAVQLADRPARVKPETPQDALRAKLEKFAPRLADMVPPGYGVGRLITGAMLAAHRDPKLLECTPISVAIALTTVAQWGLDVGVTAHLVPFNTKVKDADGTERWQMTCTPVPDYKGFIELLTAAGARKVEAHVVRADDQFDYQLGTEPYLQHVPKAGSQAEIVAAYAVVWLRGGVTQFEVVPVAEIEAVRAKSKSWAKGALPSWYARKTAIRRVAKYVGKSSQLRAVLHAEAVDLGEAVPDAEMIARLEAATGEVEGRIRIPGPSAVPEAGYDEPVPPSERITGRDAGQPTRPETVVVDLATRPRKQGPLPDDPYELGDAAE